MVLDVAGRDSDVPEMWGHFEHAFGGYHGPLSVELQCMHVWTKEPVYGCGVSECLAVEV